MNRRRGVSLVELLVVITIASAMLGLTVILLSTLLQAERRSRGVVHRYTTVRRLADRFRRDVHAATVANVVDDKQWEFTMPGGGSVVYRSEAGRLTRTERAGDKVRQREEFAMPPGATAAIEIRADVKPPMASVWMTPTVQPSEERPRRAVRAIRIDAVLGQDHRFAEEATP